MAHLVWATARGDDVGAMTDARAKAQQDARDEYRRLLYVAMTRAAERLVICGTQGEHKIPDGCWYQLVDDALQRRLRERTGRRWRRRGVALPQSADQGIAPQNIAKNNLPAAIKPTSVPAWLTSNATSDSSAPAHHHAVERRGR